MGTALIPQWKPLSNAVSPSEGGEGLGTPSVHFLGAQIPQFHAQPPHEV